MCIASESDSVKPIFQKVNRCVSRRTHSCLDLARARGGRETSVNPPTGSCVYPAKLSSPPSFRPLPFLAAREAASLEAPTSVPVVRGVRGYSRTWEYGWHHRPQGPLGTLRCPRKPRWTGTVLASLPFPPIPRLVPNGILLTWLRMQPNNLQRRTPPDVRRRAQLYMWTLGHARSRASSVYPFPFPEHNGSPSCSPLSFIPFSTRIPNRL